MRTLRGFLPDVIAAAIVCALLAVGCTDEPAYGVDGGSDGDSDSDTDGDSDSDTDADTDTDADADTDADSDADTDADSDSDTDADSDADSDADGGTDAGTPSCEIDPERIFGDVAWLASAELEGRYPGSAGNEEALVWGETLFAELGLEPAGDDGTYRQPFVTGDWGLDDGATQSVTLGGDSLSQGSEFAVINWSGGGSVTAEVVFVGYGMTVPAYSAADYPDCPLASAGYDDYAGIDVTNKIALVLRHGPGDDATVPATCPDNGLCDGAECLWNFGYKARNAALHGADAMIIVQNYANASAIMTGASLQPDGYVDGFPAVFVDRDAVETSVPSLETWADAIDASLAPSSHATGVSATISVSIDASLTLTANVLGAIPGTDPSIGDEVVVVGGHVDHLGVDLANCDSGGDACLGADDNASGTAVTMELARILSEPACAAPARTVLFALWNGEEEGLLGSAYYVDHPTFPIESTIAAYAVDMVGAGDGTNLVLYGAIDTDGTENANTWLGDVMAGSAAEMGLSWAMTQGEVLMASDHAYFATNGVPAVCAMSGALETHPYYHTPDDTIDGISEDTLLMSASMMYAGLKPLVEGTEDGYLSKGPKNAAPVHVDPNSRIFRNR